MRYTVNVLRTLTLDLQREQTNSDTHIYMYVHVQWTFTIVNSEPSSNVIMKGLHVYSDT